MCGSFVRFAIQVLVRHPDLIKHFAGRVPGMLVEASGQLAQRARGRPLVEVFSMVLRLNNPGGKLYGIIKVTDGARCQYIYNQERDEGDSGSAALLNCPTGCICALGNFIIDVDLVNDIKEQILWNFYDVSDDEYDRLLEEEINGKKGSAIVNYAVFRNAVEAIVEVILFNGDRNDPAYVYGQITARNTNFTNEKYPLSEDTGREQKSTSWGAHSFVEICSSGSIELLPHS